MVLKKFILLLILGASVVAGPLTAQNDTIDLTFLEDDSLHQQIRLFESEEILEITLSFDITRYKRTKAQEEELDAILVYKTSQSDSIIREVKVRARGEMRKSYCDMPPIRLNFKRSFKAEGDEFSSLDKIKIVTHCKPGNEAYVLKEYLAYKLYNALTENSFRVRLARITYINTAKESKPIRQFAFFIEPDEVLNSRLKAVELENLKINQRRIIPEVMDRAAIFNYMIGNTDWSVPIQHNFYVVAQPLSDNPSQAIAIPYDFDHSGLVNTDYAAPFEGLGIESVTDRKYLGICRTREQYLEALKEFADKKDEFYKIINEFPYLNTRIKKEMLTFLGGFYSGFDKRNTLANKLANECIQF
jgi:hypothetical protein